MTELEASYLNNASKLIAAQAAVIEQQRFRIKDLEGYLLAIRSLPDNINRSIGDYADIADKALNIKEN